MSIFRKTPAGLLCLAVPSLCLCLSLLLCVYLINSGQWVHFQIAFPLAVSIFRKTPAGLTCRAVPCLVLSIFRKTPAGLLCRAVPSLSLCLSSFLCVYLINSVQWRHFQIAFPLAVSIFRKTPAGLTCRAVPCLVVSIFRKTPAGLMCLAVPSLCLCLSLFLCVYLINSRQ